MTTITDQQFETARDIFRDAVLIALDEAARDVKRQILREPGTGLILGADDSDLPALFKATDKLCKQSLARLGVTAIGDELLWTEG